MLGPAFDVPGPVLQPPRHSLVDLGLRKAENGRWELGMRAVVDACAYATPWDPCPIDENGDQVDKVDKSDPFSPDWVDSSPYILELAIECNSGGLDTDELDAMVRRLLEVATAKGVEQEFWSGTLRPDNFSLVGSTPNTSAAAMALPGSPMVTGGVLAPAAVGPQYALLALSQALARCGPGARGVLHAAPILVEHWALKGFLVEQNGVLTTRARGDAVVSGTGYPGTGPTGHANATPSATTTWAYATGPVDVYLGDIDVLTGAFSWRGNRLTYRGERTASHVVSPCCSFGVLVTLPPTTD